MSRPLTVQSYIVEPARGILKSSRMQVSTVVVLRIRTEHGEIAYVLAPVDAMMMGEQLREQSLIAKTDGGT